MGTQTHLEGPYGSFVEEVAGALAGKEGYLVELGATEGTIKLLATVGNEIGVIEWRDDLSGDCRVRFLNGGGQVNFIQNAAIAHGAQFKGVVGGKIATAAAGDRVIGRKIAPASNGAANDRITGIPDRDRLPAA